MAGRASNQAPTMNDSRRWSTAASLGAAAILLVVLSIYRPGGSRAPLHWLFVDPRPMTAAAATALALSGLP